MTLVGVVTAVTSTSVAAVESMIKDDIVRQYPSFEQKAYGYTKFSDFLLGEFNSIIYIEDGNCLLL